MRHVWLAAALCALLGWFAPLSVHAEEGKADKPRDEQKVESRKEKGPGKQRTANRKKRESVERSQAKRGSRSERGDRREESAKRGPERRRPEHRQFAHSGRPQRGPHGFHPGRRPSSHLTHRPWSHPRGMWSGPSASHRHSFARGPQRSHHSFSHRGMSGHRSPWGPHHSFAHRGSQWRPESSRGPSSSSRHPQPHAWQRPGAPRGAAPWMHGPRGPQQFDFAKRREHGERDFRHADWGRRPGPDASRSRDNDDDRGERSRPEREGHDRDSRGPSRQRDGR